MATKCDTEILTLEEYLQLKKEGFEFEGQSYLFWEYMRILTEVRKINPDVKFLLENVVMGKKWESVLTQAIGVHPVLINSSMVSAQNRKRLYWTNIGLEPNGLFGDLHSTIKQPKDKGILLKDILQKEVDKKYFLSDKMLSGFISHNEVHKERGNGFQFKPKDESDKSNCLTSRYHKMGVDDTYIVAVRGRENPAALTPKRTEYGKSIRKKYEKGEIEEQRKNIQQLEPRTDGKTNCLTSVQKDNYIMFNPDGYEQYNRAYFEDGKSGTLDIKPGRQKVLLNENRTIKQLNPSKESNGKQPFQQNRIYDTDGISPALNAQLSTGSNYIMEKSPCLHGFEHGTNGQLNKSLVNGGMIRRLTPIECCRLQTVADDYFFDEDGNQVVSDTQIYKMCGNGWTVDVICHILSYLPL